MRYDAIKKWQFYSAIYEHLDEEKSTHLKLCYFVSCLKWETDENASHQESTNNFLKNNGMFSNQRFTKIINQNFGSQFKMTLTVAINTIMI